jgi:hypothetical protein
LLLVCPAQLLQVNGTTMEGTATAKQAQDTKRYRWQKTSHQKLVADHSAATLPKLRPASDTTTNRNAVTT